MPQITRHFSPVGITCALCYLVPQLLLITKLLFFPSVHGGEWFLTLIISAPWVILTTAIEPPLLQLTAATVLATGIWYTLGLVFERLYCGRPRKTPVK